MKKFSLVSYLQGDLKSAVRNLQEELFEVTGSRACLDTWEPHLTLGSGPIVNQQQEEKLLMEIGVFSKNTKPLILKLSGYSFIEKSRGINSKEYTPYVVAIKVVVTPELEMCVARLQKIIDEYDLWYEQSLPYHPHVTIAFRDLTQEGFEKAKLYLKEKDFSETFNISSISLVEKLFREDREYCTMQFLNN